MSQKSALIQLTQTPFHIYNRGVDKGQIFFRESDYQRFVMRLADALNNFQVRLHLYCLMPNHFHLILEQEASLEISRYMQEVTGFHARAINKSRRRRGPLFESRFKIEAVANPGSLLRLCRYVLFNPVYAGLANSPAEWKYSSYRECVGQAASDFLTLDPLLSLVNGCEGFSEFLRDYEPTLPESVHEYVRG
jgi:REP element-mobilizing transposase RayT